MDDDLNIRPEDLPVCVATDTANITMPHIVLNVHGRFHTRFATREEADAYVNKVNAPTPVASEGALGPGPTAPVSELMQDNMHDTGAEPAKKQAQPKEKSMPKKKRAAKKRELAPVVKKSARKTAGVKKATKRKRR